MKTNTILVTTAMILGSSLVLAAEQKQESPQPDAEGSITTSMEGMTGGCMPMHDHMDKMQAQIDAIYETTDPDKRAELIEAHMLSMGEMMKKTRDMHDGKGMMDKGEMHKGEKHKGMMDKGEMHKGEKHKGMMDKGEMDKGEMDKDMKMGQMTHGQSAGEETPTPHEQHHEQTASN